MMNSSLNVCACRYSDNQRAQDALNVTLLHWGVHAWIVYVLVGLNLGFVAYRWDLPMTVRTCFYPIIGEALGMHGATAALVLTQGLLRKTFRGQSLGSPFRLGCLFFVPAFKSSDNFASLFSC